MPDRRTGEVARDRSTGAGEAGLPPEPTVVFTDPTLLLSLQVPPPASLMEQSGIPGNAPTSSGGSEVLSVRTSWSRSGAARFRDRVDLAPALSGFVVPPTVGLNGNGSGQAAPTPSNEAAKLSLGCWLSPAGKSGALFQGVNWLVTV